MLYVPAIGETLPDFLMTDSDGQLVEPRLADRQRAAW